MVFWLTTHVHHRQVQEAVSLPTIQSNKLTSLRWVSSSMWLSISTWTRPLILPPSRQRTLSPEDTHHGDMETQLELRIYNTWTNTQEAAIALLPLNTHPQSWAEPHTHYKYRQILAYHLLLPHWPVICPVNWPAVLSSSEPHWWSQEWGP